MRDNSREASLAACRPTEGNGGQGAGSIDGPQTARDLFDVDAG
jgi:hypothetical protein